MLEFDRKVGIDILLKEAQKNINNNSVLTANTV